MDLSSESLRECSDNILRRLLHALAEGERRLEKVGSSPEYGIMLRRPQKAGRDRLLWHVSSIGRISFTRAGTNLGGRRACMAFSSRVSYTCHWRHRVYLLRIMAVERDVGATYPQ